MILFSSASRRSAASATYSGLSSMPMYFRSLLSQATPTVPEPKNGSRMKSPGLVDAKMHGLIRVGGNVAKCAHGDGCVLILQTERRFLNFLSAVSSLTAS